MIEDGALSDEVHEAAVGHVAAVLDLEAGQLGTPPGDNGQPTVGQLLAAAQDDGADVELGGRVSTQESDDGFEGQVGVGLLAREGDAVPEAGVPCQEVESTRESGALH